MNGHLDLRPLTSLRFAAALLVFFDHAPLTRSVAERYELGGYGVGFFFLLSGFILMVNYHREFRDRISQAAMMRFYIARFARVYPLQVTATILAVVALITFGEPDHNKFGHLWTGLSASERRDKVLATLFLIQPWSGNTSLILGVNPPAWSIADEAFFYALFPFAAWYLLRAFRSFGSTPVLGFASLLWASGLFIFLKTSPGGWFTYFQPPLRFADFFIGMMLGLAFLKGKPPARLGSVLEVASIVASGFAVALIPFIPEQLRPVLWMMPFSAIVIAVFARQTGLLSRLLSHPRLIALGEASFAFYLVHNIVIVAMVPHFGTSIATMIFSFVITLLLSFALFRWIEAPMRRIIKARFVRTEASAALAIEVSV